jgi:uncharacterized protein (TIGR02266 family)
VIVPVTLELGYRSPGAFLVAYATQLSKGGLFVETAAPPAVGTPLTLRLVAPPAAAVSVTGAVAWTRDGQGGQPAGMGIALAATEELGAAVDEAAGRFGGIAILLRTGEAAPRAILGRYLRSIFSACELLDVDDGADASAAFERLDAAVIDLDSSGPGGFDLCARLRAHARAGSAAVVGLAQLERDRTGATRAGFDATGANPPALAELEAALLRCLARPVSTHAL